MTLTKQTEKIHTLYTATMITMMTKVSGELQVLQKYSLLSNVWCQTSYTGKEPTEKIDWR